MKNNASETGNEASNNPGVPRDKAEELAIKYLKNRCYNYDKVIFHGFEEIQSGELNIYRFNGLIIEKTRSLLDRISRDNRSVTYKFVIEVDAQKGTVLDYFLT